MFFNYARFFPQQQQLDSLLASNPDCDLETILSAEGILQEIKGISSNKFADHLITHPELYKQMIDYIIQFEDELIDKKTQIQYPFYCSEILGSQNQKLLDFLFERPEEGIEADAEMIRVSLYDELIKFLENDAFNTTSAGYFSKTYLAIIKKRGYDVWTSLVNNKAILNNLIKHIDCKHIGEIIEKLIILDTTQEFQEQNFMNERKILLERIIQLMQKKYYCSEIVDNICEILSEIASKNMSCLYYNSPEIIPFIDQIRRPDLLFNLAVKTKRAAPFQVLINLVDIASKEQKKEEDDEVIHNTDKDYSIFDNIIPELPQQLLSEGFNLTNFKNPNQETVKPFGLYRMMLLKLITILVQTNEISIISPLIDAGLIQALQTICIQYPNNNQIHVLTEKILKIILDTNDKPIIDKIFTYGGLINYIINYHTQENSQKGYIAVLTSLSNNLLQKSQNSELISDYLEDKNWIQFVRSRLSSINLKEKSFLCNVNPKQKQDQEVGDDETIIEILKKFNDSQHQQYSQIGHQRQNNQYTEEQQQEQQDNDEQQDKENENDNEKNQEYEQEGNQEEEQDENQVYNSIEQQIFDSAYPTDNSDDKEDKYVMQQDGGYHHTQYWKVADNQNIEQLIENYS